MRWIKYLVWVFSTLVAIYAMVLAIEFVTISERGAIVVALIVGGIWQENWPHVEMPWRVGGG